MRTFQRSMRFWGILPAIALITFAEFALTNGQTAFSQGSASGPSAPARHSPTGRSTTHKLSVPQANAAAAAERNVSGQWTDTYGYVWTLSQDDSGNITGSLGATGCPDAIWSVTGSVTAARKFSITGTNPDGGDESCVASFQYNATWTSTTSASVAWINSDDVTGSTTMTFQPAVPTDFQQVGPGVANPGGILHFNYSWTSTSGNLSDLANCKVGENVSYPSAANPFAWPSPPYNGSTPNPTILWVAGDDGTAQDNHKHAAFLEPYTANSFTATQNYDYKCRPGNTVTNFTNWTGIAIGRTVSDRTGRGCYGYTVTKSGASASVPRLPGVPTGDCKKASATQEGQDFANSAADIGLSASLPEAAVGLNEPLFADLTIRNLRPKMVGVDLGLNRKGNLELTIAEPSGQHISRTLDSTGFGGLGEILLAPAGTYVQRLLLNEWYEFPAVGTYRVKITLLNDDSSAESDSSPSTEFSVEIGQRDLQKLANISAALADTAVGGNTLKASMEAANTLSYIRDPVAIDSLVRVLQYGSLVETYAVEGLGRIGTPEAVAALMAAQNHPDEEVRAAVRFTLTRLKANPLNYLGPVD